MKRGLFRLPPQVQCVGVARKILISGPQGKIFIYLPVKFIQRGCTICFSRPLKNLEMVLFKQAIYGVSLLYKISLTLHGIGYRVENRNNMLFLKVGYSHALYIEVPNNVEVLLYKNNIACYSAQLITLRNFVTKIRKIRFPDVYKGGGVLYSGEIIKKKEGKKS